MKKICIVTTLSITIKSFLIDYANFLSSLDYDVTFICNSDNSMRIFCNDKIHYIPVKMKRGISFDAPFVIHKLRSIFRKEEFDIIQYSTPNAAFYASIAAKKEHCKCRLYCQWGIRYMGFNKGIKRRLFRYIEKSTCKNSTYIECESFSIHNFSLKEKLYDSTNSCVTWNGSACGVNLSKFNTINRLAWRNEIRNSLKIPYNAIVFGYCGRLTKDKGINELLKAFKDFDNPKAYLLLIGSLDVNNHLSNDLVNWAKESNNVIFVDWTNKLEKYYSAMDVFVSLSYREGFGLVVIEAAAMNLPAIVSNVEGQIDTVTDGVDGWIVDLANTSNIINAMNFCVNNSNKLSIFGESAYEKVKTKYEQKQLFEFMTSLRNSLIKGEQK